MRACARHTFWFFKYYGKELLNKLELPRELTTIEKVRLGETIGRISQEKLGISVRCSTLLCCFFICRLLIRSFFEALELLNVVEHGLSNCVWSYLPFHTVICLEPFKDGFVASASVAAIAADGDCPWIVPRREMVQMLNGSPIATPYLRTGCGHLLLAIDASLVSSSYSFNFLFGQSVLIAQSFSP